MPFVRSVALLVLGAALAPRPLAAEAAAPVAVPAAMPAASPELPLKFAPRPTAGAISAADLMTRLYVFADDSMMGRQVGTEYNLKGTAYIEREVRRLGLVPAGDSGTYFQNVPVHAFGVEGASVMKVGDETLALGTDYYPWVQSERRLVLDSLGTVYGGSTLDSTTWLASADAAGKVVVLHSPASSTWFRGAIFGPTSRYGRAAAVVVDSYERIPANYRSYIAGRTVLRGGAAPPVGPPTVFVTSRVARLLFPAIESAATGAAGRPLAGTLLLREARVPGRNVVAILPGSDPALKGEYVAIGAHNDHIGFNRHPVDHDSVRAFNMVALQQGADSPTPTALTTEQQARIRTMLDSMRRLRPARLDSIDNGADDDGSGSVSVLEIAEAFATAKSRPKRSILFIWHTGEEAGLYGSQYFTDHPTVPRDSIAAELNMDMVGRGRASDITGETKDHALVHGGPGYLQLVGSRRLSTELGDLVETVNRDDRLGFDFDYSMDANGHPQNIYCRSDHYEYARYGIPIVFFTTGGHADYHQVTDEAQYIDYAHMAQVATLVHHVARRVADLDHRVVVDKPKPDPAGRCMQ
jgi:hypothetical protein